VPGEPRWYQPCPPTVPPTAQQPAKRTRARCDGCGIILATSPTVTDCGWLKLAVSNDGGGLPRKCFTNLILATTAWSWLPLEGSGTCSVWILFPTNHDCILRCRCHWSSHSADTQGLEMGLEVAGLDWGLERKAKSKSASVGQPATLHGGSKSTINVARKRSLGV
jgi:hypothetical protein